MRKKIVAVAAKEIGYKEGRNNATKYGQWYGMDNNPWCAMFVSWCAAQVGVPITVVPKLAYVPYYYEFYVASSRYKSRGSGYVPHPGDLVLFGSNDHIGIVEKASGGKLITIEGNTSATGNSSNGDGVYRRTRSLNDNWIKGYCIPDYKEDKMTGEEIYKELQNYLNKQQPPEWAREELAEAVAAGITDGTQPCALVPRYQAAIMALRATKKESP